MDTATLLPLLTGPVAGLAILVWVVWMQRRDLADLRKALDAERRRADSAEEAARTTNSLLAGLINRVRQ
jgi:hypothetical protein